MIQINVIQPCRLLSEYVNCFWILEKGGGLHVERLFPSGEAQMIFHIKNPFSESDKDETYIQPEFQFCGQFTTFKNISSTSEAQLIGIVFKPYSVKPLLSIPGSYYNNVVNLSDFNKEYYELGRSIQEAKNNVARITLLENFLLQKFYSSNEKYLRLVKNSIDNLTDQNWKIKINKLRKDYQISERHFQRIFKDHIGISLRSFSEIIRFRKALSILGTSTDLTQAALESGYYDQPQFIKSFKKFTGYTPGEYMKVSGMSV